MTEELLRLSVELWHPNCWTSELAVETGAGVLGHGGVTDGMTAHERCTVHGDDTKQVVAAVETAQASDRIGSVREVTAPTRQALFGAPAIGTYSQDIFIKYDVPRCIEPAFRSRGFVLDDYARMEDRKEFWQFLVRTDRETLNRMLDNIRIEHDAEITVQKITPIAPDDHDQVITEREAMLTPRQHEALTLARKRGYYTWPREITVRELAAELDIGKTTFLHHLRTAEARLLAPDSGSESDVNDRTMPR